MKTATINIYSFSELDRTAKEKAISEHRDFELQQMQISDFVSGDAEYDTEEGLKKAYKEQYRYYLENDEPIIESIKMNDYLFFSDGDIADVTTYCGKHPKSGITELKLGNDVYKIN